MSLTKEKLDELIRNSFLNATNSFLQDCLGSSSSPENTKTKKSKKKGDGGSGSGSGPSPESEEEEAEISEEESGVRLLKRIQTDPIKYDDIVVADVTPTTIDYSVLLSSVSPDNASSDFLFKKSGREKSIQEVICEALAAKQPSVGDSPWKPVKDNDGNIKRYKINQLFEDDAEFKGLKIKGKVIVDNNDNDKSYITVTLIAGPGKSAALNIYLKGIIQGFDPEYATSSSE